jgi:hypothetical protein
MVKIVDSDLRIMNAALLVQDHMRLLLSLAVQHLGKLRKLGLQFLRLGRIKDLLFPFVGDVHVG